jgi:plastocyanin
MTYLFGRTAGRKTASHFSWPVLPMFLFGRTAGRKTAPHFSWPVLPIFCVLFMAGPAFAADHVIVQKGRQFHPAEIDIVRGDTLTVTNDDEFIHQIYVAGDNFSFDSDERAPGQNITETFTAAGTFEVRCHIHPKMRLVVRVK